MCKGVDYTVFGGQIVVAIPLKIFQCGLVFYIPLLLRFHQHQVLLADPKMGRNHLVQLLPWWTWWMCPLDWYDGRILLSVTLVGLQRYHPHIFSISWGVQWYYMRNNTMRRLPYMTLLSLGNSLRYDVFGLWYVSVILLSWCRKFSSKSTFISGLSKLFCAPYSEPGRGMFFCCIQTYRFRLNFVNWINIRNNWLCQRIIYFGLIRNLFK